MSLKFEQQKHANDLALKWFEMHSVQRLTMINYFIVISGFCVAGYFAAMEIQNEVAASVVALVLIVITVCFKQLDRRTSQLLCLGEDYLKISLPKLQATLKTKKLDLANLAENKAGVWSYRRTFNVLFWTFGLAGALGAIYPWMQA